MASGDKHFTAKIVNAPNHQTFYGEGALIRTSQHNIFVSILSDERDDTVEKGFVSADEKNITFSGVLSDKGPIRIKQATFGMPIAQAAALAGSILNFLKLNRPEILESVGITMEQLEKEALDEQV